MEINKVYCGDSLEVMQTFPNDSIDMILSSPPYFQQRKYNSGNMEIGWEKSGMEYAKLLGVYFEEALRVIKSTGSLYLNLGSKHVNGDLCPTPWYTAIELVNQGWHLKSDIIFAKRNCMPGSYSNRPIDSHEYVFLMTKRKTGYFYDWEAIATEPVESTKNDKRPKGVLRQCVNKNSKYHGNSCDKVISAQFRKQDNVGRSDYTGFNDRYTAVDKVRRRSVWRLTLSGSQIEHYAMMEPKLADLCIRAGCPENGIVLDPFCGVNTSGLVARSLNRNYIGIELNPDYVIKAENYLNDYKYDPDQLKVIKR